MVLKNIFRESHASRFCVSPFREACSIIEGVTPEDLGYAENEMTMLYSLEHFFTEPFPEFHYPFLMTRGAEVAACV
jgi:hypothetical protein